MRRYWAGGGVALAPQLEAPTSEGGARTVAGLPARPTSQAGRQPACGHWPTTGTKPNALGGSACCGQRRGQEGVQAAGEGVVQLAPRLAARHVGVGQDDDAAEAGSRGLQLLRLAWGCDGGHQE